MKKHLKKLKQEIFTGGRTIALISTIFLGISAFLPWGKTAYVSVNGLSGDGVEIILIGVLAFLLLFIKKIPIWIPLFIGAIGLTIGIIDFEAMYQATKQISGEVGIGLYTVVISSFGIVIGTIIEIIEERKKKLNLFYFDKNK